MSTATAKAPKPRTVLTLRDTSDLMLAVDAWIETHIDELELNGGALPDDLAALLDEITGAREERAEAIVHKLDEFTGNATSAKATKDRAARREKVWNNASVALKAYALHEVERNGGAKIKAASATLRIQVNGQPSTDVRFDDEQLLAFADVGGPLAPFITVERVPTLDRKALGAAYEMRAEELRDEADLLLGESDVPEETLMALGPMDPTGVAALQHVLANIRRDYVDRALATEFPGVACVRGVHLRID